MRESPALDVLELLQRRGAILSYSDPHVPAFSLGGLDMASVAEREVGGDIDCAVITTNHTAFDYAPMPARFPLVVDTRNALKANKAANVLRL